MRRLLGDTWHNLIRLAILLGGVCLSAPVFASTLRGTITDAESGEALPFANVVLSGEADINKLPIRRGVMGDDAGRYEFLNIPAGRYEVRFAYVGYRERAESVRVGPDQVVTLSVSLVPEPIEVEEIVVEADRLAREREVQTGFVNIDASTLDAIPAVGESDPIRSLQLLPGVQAASDISSGLYIRGGGPDQTLVLLDDVPVYNPTHAFGFFSTFNSDAIEDVTLYKGAYPAEHGGRLGAVLDVRSRETTDAKEITGKAAISTIAARLMLEGPTGDNRWLVSGRRTYLEPFLAALRKDTPEIPYYYFYDLNGKFATPRGEDWTVINGYRGRDNVRFDPDADTNVEINWGNTLLSATYNRLVSESLLGKVSISASEYESVTDARIFNTVIEIDNRLRDVTLRADIDWERNPRHRIDVGAQASVYDFRFDQRFNRDQGVDFSSTPLELSAFVDDQRLPRTGMSLRTGLRTRYITDGRRFLLEPRMAASQMLPGGVRVKFGGGVYHQYVQLITTEGFSAGDVYVPVDESAKPGRSWQSVIGIEWELSRRYQFSVEGYLTRLDNLLSFRNTGPADRESFAAADVFNTGGTGYATGVEFFVQRRVGRLSGWLGYALGWSRRTFEELNGGETFPPKYDRRHDVNAVVEYKAGPWLYGASAVYATGQAFTPGSARYRLRDPALGSLTEGTRVLPGERNSARLLPYHRLDLSVRRDFNLFGAPAQAFLQIFNVYSRRNEWFVQFDKDKPDVEVVKMLPIIPSLGLSFKF